MKKLYALIILALLVMAAFPCEATSLEADVSSDTFLNQGAATTNYSTLTYFSVRGSGSVHVALVVADLSGIIPDGATITGATLYGYHYSDAPSATAGKIIQAIRIRRTDTDTATATWNQYKSGSNWTTAGGLNETTDIDTSILSTSVVPAINNWQTWTVTSHVADAMSNRSGLLLIRLSRTDNTVTGGLYYSTENATNKPYITIGYTTASGVVCPELTGTPLSCQGAGTVMSKRITSAEGTDCHSRIDPGGVCD